MGLVSLLAVLAGSLGAALAFRWARVPLWALTGGLVGAAAVNLGLGLEVEAPNLLVLGAKLLIGTAIGASLSPDVFRQFMRFFGPGVLAVTTVLAVGVLFGWGFAAWGLMEPGESMFGLVPGGVGEMVATAASLGLDGAVVTGAHMVRLFTVVLSLPLILRAAEAIHRRRIAGTGSDQAE
ncbi:AbrB family transcriptional regulator [Prauserella rugosa]|uniref:Ammonia monooxygenase n=1 Tax=Prauserella rugosa TaxID=43354 RepID=A0A660CE23_9PSEU|nr:AbrB family transcriptional regulator [Prauserella rugosa]KID32115.1 membrane protein AbrB duplication [Prauserella sp. Am3]KMS88138.1 AbrB family transcriptional regulator [Streptomyces regensis]TWH20644.1 hypothetical protein JD82_02491 [Prauserella rugosa]